MKSKLGEHLTKIEREWLMAGLCPDCAGQLTDRPHVENGVHIGTESDIACCCGFAAVMKPPHGKPVAKGAQS